VSYTRTRRIVRPIQTQMRPTQTQMRPVQTQMRPALTQLHQHDTLEREKVRARECQRGRPEGCPKRALFFLVWAFSKIFFLFFSIFSLAFSKIREETRDSGWALIKDSRLSALGTFIQNRSEECEKLVLSFLNIQSEGSRDEISRRTRVESCRCCAPQRW
jgi:hypothetical protein